MGGWGEGGGEAFAREIYYYYNNYYTRRRIKFELVYKMTITRQNHIREYKSSLS